MLLLTISCLWNVTSLFNCKYTSRTINVVLSLYTVKLTYITRHPQVRQGLKTYSEWPTYPQLYVNGELVGGLDIIREMHESGDLSDTLK